MKKTYRLLNGDTLVVSVDMGAWQTLTFGARDFRRPDAALPSPRRRYPG